MHWGRKTCKTHYLEAELADVTTKSFIPVPQCWLQSGYWLPPMPQQTSPWPHENPSCPLLRILSTELAKVIGSLDEARLMMKNEKVAAMEFSLGQQSAPVSSVSVSCRTISTMSSVEIIFCRLMWVGSYPPASDSLIYNASLFMAT